MFSKTHSLLVKISPVIPLSNANVVLNHLMILLNGPEIGDFDFEKACEYWEDKKNRKINKINS